MKPVHHIAISITLSAILYTSFKSWGLCIASLLSGILIDLDHMIDYILEHGFRFNEKEFFSFFYEEKHRKIILLFHGWELLIIFLILTIITKYDPWMSGLLIGYALHIISDYIYSKTYFRTYSLLWRWSNGFESEVLFPRDRGYNQNLKKYK